jgi:hypothetical protein
VVEQPKTPERLRELIDEALEEIERTELEMLDLLSDVLGSDAVQRIASHIDAAQRQPRSQALLRAKRTPPPESGPDES